ncbi:MAG: right-handed parallel beta-helix repeat-containing protein [Vulcanimicrobiota bacterium]
MAIVLLLVVSSGAFAEELTLTPENTDSLGVFLARARSGDVIELRSGQYVLDQGLVLSGLNNVTLRGRGEVELILTNLDQAVIRLEKCSRVFLVNLSARHQRPANEYQCEGAVIDISESSKILVKNCDLNGCGAAGVYAHDAKEVVVSGCRIHHNTYAGVWGYRSSLMLYRNRIEKNASAVKVDDCDLQMNENVVKDNDHPLYYPDFATEVLNK